MKPLPSELNPPNSKLESASTLIKRFSAGAALGLVIGAIQWVGYIYVYGYQVPLTRSIIFCLLMAIICGLLTLKWGYKILENLLEFLN